MKTFVLLTTLIICIGATSMAQQYVSPTAPVQTGKSHGMKVKLISGSRSAKTYVLVFSIGVK